jgi:hypothetical protein
MALKGNVDPAGDTRLSDRFKDGGLPFVAMDAEPLISLRMSRPNKRFFGTPSRPRRATTVAAANYCVHCWNWARPRSTMGTDRHALASTPAGGDVA